MRDYPELHEVADYVTVDRAMELLNVHTKERVMYQVRAGRIRAWKWADALMLSREDVERLAATPMEERRGGRPRKIIV